MSGIKNSVLKIVETKEADTKDAETKEATHIMSNIKKAEYYLK